MGEPTDTSSLASMLSHVGLDPRGRQLGRLIPSARVIALFAEGKIDAYLGFAPRAAGAARPEDRPTSSSTPSADRPWSQYFCCMVIGQPGLRPQAPGGHEAGAARDPQGRRPLRAAIPSAAPGARGRGLTPRTTTMRSRPMKEIPYNRWRDSTPRTRPLLRAPPARGGHGQVEPAEDHRPGHRLALP